MKPAEAFAQGEPAWVPLGKLFLKIEHDLGIPPDAAMKQLRPAFESFAIRTDVVQWDPTSTRINNGSLRFLSSASQVGWARTRGAPDAHCVAEDGWKHVNWAAGTLRGCVVRVLWRDVQHELAPLVAALGALPSEERLSEAEDTRKSLVNVHRLLPEDLRTDPKLCAAFAGLYDYAQEQLKEGRRPKRDIAADVVSRRTGYPERRLRDLYRYLPNGWRNHPRTQQ